MTMIATPALSSAPSRVVPSLVTRSWPTRSASPGMSSGSSTWPGSPGSRSGAPSQPRCTSGRTPVPETPGAVSTCAIRPTVGAPATVPGTRREDVAVLGQLDVLEPERAQLLEEESREVELLLGRRVRGRRRVGLRVDHDVAQEACEHVLRQLLGERARVARLSQANRTAGAARRSSPARRGGPVRGCSRWASGAASSAG